MAGAQVVFYKGVTVTRAIESQHRPPGQLRCLGEGLRVGGPGTPHGTRLGDLKENWFLLFSN